MKGKLMDNVVETITKTAHTDNSGYTKDKNL